MPCPEMMLQGFLRLGPSRFVKSTRGSSPGYWLLKLGAIRSGSPSALDIVGAKRDLGLRNGPDGLTVVGYPFIINASQMPSKCFGPLDGGTMDCMMGSSASGGPWTQSGKVVDVSESVSNGTVKKIRFTELAPADLELFAQLKTLYG